MADSSIKGILSLKDVVIRQNNNVWPPANIFFNTTYNGNRVYTFNIYTQQTYVNQFVYYVINTVDAANPITASDFTDNILSGQLYLGPDGSTSFTKPVVLNNKKIFNIQLRTGSASGTILTTSDNIEIGLGDFSVIPVELLVVGGGGGGGSIPESGATSGGSAGDGGGGIGVRLSGVNPRNGTAGTTNTGGGGGGNYAGGSGIVIIRHSLDYSTGTTTGSPNVITAGGNTIYRFWQSGSITFNS